MEWPDQHRDIYATLGRIVQSIEGIMFYTASIFRDVVHVLVPISERNKTISSICR